MTIRVNVSDLADLAEFLAHIDAGEDFELLRDGETVATINSAKKAASTPRKRVPGVWAHYGKLQDPNLFLRPDPDLEEAADGPIFPEK
ncbi:hypothetical protein [Caulobacter sp. DWR2-3-1b2]|uniref:hypothetical protein n=1 Tax=unclassified Caulobacter TaxID=2648921 RepID=UPI003CF4EE69